MMKTLTFIIAALLFTLGSDAREITIDNKANTAHDYIALQTAVHNTNAQDTMYIHGAYTGYVHGANTGYGYANSDPPPGIIGAGPVPVNHWKAIANTSGLQLN